MDDIEIVVAKAAEWSPRELDRLSIEALEEYVTDLRREVERVKSEISHRHAVRGKADAIFRD